jgi:hypothetical protein
MRQLKPGDDTIHLKVYIHLSQKKGLLCVFLNVL